MSELYTHKIGYAPEMKTLRMEVQCPIRVAPLKVSELGLGLGWMPENVWEAFAVNLASDGILFDSPKKIALGKPFMFELQTRTLIGAPLYAKARVVACEPSPRQGYKYRIDAEIFEIG